MNYYAHGRLHLSDPYFLAGAAVPDWLNVSDRGVRVRSKQATPWIDDDDACLAAVARGIAQHHHDDGWFHSSTAFNELQWQFTATIRDALDNDASMRAGFLGHILVEILLDAVLIEDDPAGLEAYYEAHAAVDPQVIEAAVNRMASRPAERLAWFVGQFSQVRFLWDYLDDAKLCYRLNQVMRRVGLPELPPKFGSLLPEAREHVRRRQDELLTPPVDVAITASSRESP
jgi:hypothetical protein